MNIYVDELPKSCGDCRFCEKYGYYLYCSRLCKKLEYLDKEKECPLQSLEDYNKQIRKTVCDEIKEKARNMNNDQFYIKTCEILDNIQGETNGN